MDLTDADDLAILARSAGPRGEAVLRRRDRDGHVVDELIVNGAFAMDSAETSSERALAGLALRRAPRAGRMLIGGLGLGYTAAAALDLGVATLDVVEIEPALVQWAHERVTPTLAAVATDPRTRLVVGDVADAIRHSSPVGGWDAIALDVDNGPDFLIHATNAALYAADLLTAAWRALAPGGRLAVWCQGSSPVLMETLRTISPTAAEHLFEVTRGRRRFDYAICTLDRPGRS